MLGNKSGFVACVKKEVPHITVTHCVLHCHALAAKSLPEQLTNVLSITVSAINCIRWNALKPSIQSFFVTKLGLNMMYFFITLR